jgi:branched-chain amino acid transport system substrate-binding protein
VVKQGGDSWFFLTADYAFGHSLEKDTADVVKANGGKVLGAVRHPLNASDFSSFLLQAQASKAKIVGLANAGGDTINSIKAANEFGMTKNQKLAGLLCSDHRHPRLGLPTTQGMMFTDRLLLGPQRRDARLEQALLRAAKKRMPSMLQAGVYSAYLTLPEGGAGGRYRRGRRGDGAAQVDDRSTTCSPRTARSARTAAWCTTCSWSQVKKPAESKEPWDYYNVRSVIPGERGLPAAVESRCPLVKK